MGQSDTKMGTIKDRNGMDLTEEDVKRWQEYTEELYKNDLHDSDNHHGVITQLEPDVLEYKVKWALGSITTHKVSGGDRIPLELFQILKDDVVKVLHSICQQICKFSSGHRTGQFPLIRLLFVSNPEKGNAKMCSNDHTIAHISCTSTEKAMEPPKIKSDLFQLFPHLFPMK